MAAAPRRGRLDDPEGEPPPSGSESFSSTRTEIVRPGLTVITSSTAMGCAGASSRGAMPTRIEPVARAPSASTTAYWNVSVPARVLSGLELEPVGPGRDDGAEVGVRVLAEELHGVAVWVDAAERDGDAYRLARDDPAGDRGGHGCRVRLGVWFADRDRAPWPWRTARGRLDAIDGLVLAGRWGAK